MFFLKSVIQNNIAKQVNQFLSLYQVFQKYQ